MDTLETDEPPNQKETPPLTVTEDEFPQNDPFCEDPVVLEGWASL